MICLLDTWNAAVTQRSNSLTPVGNLMVYRNRVCGIVYSGMKGTAWKVFSVLHNEIKDVQIKICRA